MAGLNLRGFRDVMSESLVERNNKGFHPNEGFSSSPVPAANPSTLPEVPKFSPRNNLRDPVPATAAADCYVPAFIPNVGFSVDPVPARSA